MSVTTKAAVPAGTTPPAPRSTVSDSESGISAFVRRLFSQRTLPYLLLLPATATILVMLGWPVVSVVLTSFRKLDLGELFQGKIVWVGLDNYTTLISDSSFWQITLRTVLFTAACVVCTVGGGLLVALLMKHVYGWVRVVIQLALVLAWAMPILAATTVFQWMFDQNYGILNKTLVVLGFSGFHHYSWFQTGFSTMAVIVILITWQGIPFVAFTLYAGVLGVPSDLYEAAGLDGASSWQTFRSVTWTALRPLVNVVTFLSLLWDFKVFTQVWAIRQGGPDGGSQTLPTLQYLKGIATQHFGVAAAVSVIMILALVVLTGQNLRLMLRTEEVD
ncbi:carbohydrate ABC transporter permease [Kutzneria buriramensis]|uniref:N,N'-diacetylchitobiose transport system permease protein n=1 Tax=Kutzneria buriramensis TaxID=1045776 RepID=A0A3E0HV51_9PSEU|nr:sugar ABC transporter permease [Kutzneria buriramensis]REH50334.1 N,N'-diacetylchitobiose transport system permease protein [Kutzneria buriramensis]